jgi:peroxiredoxin
MAIEENTPSRDVLQRQLQERQKQSRMSEEDKVVAKRNLDMLIQSGLVEQSIKEGEQAPDFVLPNGRGEETRLSDLLAHGPVVLVFYRGAWCPYCNLALRAYQSILPQMKKLGVSLVAVSPQTPDHSLSLAETLNLEFEVVSDVGNTVARSYGLVFAVSEPLREVYKKIGADLVTYNGDDAWELPLPGSYVIGQDGTIQLAFVDADYTKRLEPAAILEALEKLREL